jgi:DNA-binding transcriptional LysR family regulator
MDLFELETFLAVARQRTFSGAAQQLHRTQPAISQAIKKLEDELGELLFDRSSRGGKLTDAGETLKDYAEKLLNLRGETHQALTDLRRMQQGKLCIAANEFTALYLLLVLGDYRARHPMVRIAVQRSLASQIPHELLNHNVELGVISFQPDDSRLRSIVVYRDELAFIVSPSHPLTRSKSVSIKQLGAETFVAHNVSSPYRARVLQAFQRHKTPLNMDVELPTMEAIKRFVAMGNGVALLPATAITRELHTGELVHIPVREMRFERKLRLVYRKGATFSHASKAFLQVVKSFAQQRGGRFMWQPD